MIRIKTREEIAKMRRAGKLAAQVLEYIEPFVKDGETTGRLDALCNEYIMRNKAIPAPLNYHGYPRSICTSINNVVCHGIPSQSVELKEGDIVNVDITVILEGYHGDTSKTYIIGQITETVKLDCYYKRRFAFRTVRAYGPCHA